MLGRCQAGPGPVSREPGPVWGQESLVSASEGLFTLVDSNSIYLVFC